MNVFFDLYNSNRCNFLTSKNSVIVLFIKITGVNPMFLPVSTVENGSALNLRSRSICDFRVPFSDVLGCRDKGGMSGLTKRVG